MILHQFPVMTPGNTIINSSKETCPRDSYETFDQFENF